MRGIRGNFSHFSENSVLTGVEDSQQAVDSLRDHVSCSKQGQLVKYEKYNKFYCDAIQGKGNGKLYTDNDSAGRTDIITQINVKSSANAHKSTSIEVKVDPGAETNCMPLTLFRATFPD